MSFGLVGRLGPRMRWVVGIGDCFAERGNFGGGCEALMHRCVKVCEAIELPFRVVRGVDPGIGVLHGVHILQGEGEVLGVFLSLGSNGI